MSHRSRHQHAIAGRAAPRRRATVRSTRWRTCTRLSMAKTGSSAALTTLRMPDVVAGRREGVGLGDRGPLGAAQLVRGLDEEGDPHLDQPASSGSIERSASSPSGFQRSRARGRSGACTSYSSGSRTAWLGSARSLPRRRMRDPRRLGADREPEHAEVAGRQVVDRDQRLHEPLVRGRGQRGEDLVVGVEQQQVAARLDAAGGRTRRCTRSPRTSTASSSAVADYGAAGELQPAVVEADQLPAGGAVGRERGPGRRRLRGERRARTAASPARTSYVEPVRPARSQGWSPSSVDRLGVGVAHGHRAVEVQPAGGRRPALRRTPRPRARRGASKSLIRPRSRPRRRRPARRSSRARAGAAPGRRSCGAPARSSRRGRTRPPRAAGSG